MLLGVLARRAGLDEVVTHAGDHGPVAFVVVASMACAVGVPRQVVAFAGGLAYGFWPGSILALVAEVVACGIDFVVARRVGRRWAERFLARDAARGGRVARLERFLVARAFTATLTVRLLPFGSNLAFNLLAGVSTVAAAPFLLASALGFVPQTVVFSLLGGGVRVSEGEQLALAAAFDGRLHRARPSPSAAPRCAGLVEGEHVRRSEPGGLNVGGGCKSDGVELALELAGPEVQELAEHRVLRGEVQVLPEIGLEQARVVRQVVEDFGGGEAVVPELQTDGHPSYLPSGGDPTGTVG